MNGGYEMYVLYGLIVIGCILAICIGIGIFSIGKDVDEE